ncbi:tRNA (adenosine(37)-N6)-threonylcarbamoyltransferase complex dimerization subunit type 1 TsaB [Fodinicola acaciae]|uniref:tRNA (adenosine(37)-N6)-threonylcarbamoyltransferase complex dimerization subunit type 1 TsaB n=1 Tax=Fodinicola acaciae TaxID=2681555 RepID=UPI0013D1C1A6|nr:tRNA (adenosine(37)-N6)-threonylcarbamoyltransferase complex dimerization subunit type 1 TsaB [Fodinicola acaciae]
MFALVLDTATPAVSAGIAEVTDATVAMVAEDQVVDGRRHGEALAVLIDGCLTKAGLTVGDLDAVVAGVGPGPFTGLRVGLVTAAAIADARDIPAYGVCSLDAIATDDDSLLVATDARRREVYWATYENGRRTNGPNVDKPVDINTTATTAAGAGAKLYDLGLPTTGPDYPVLKNLADRAADRIRDRAESEPLTPLYLRRPDTAEPGARKKVTR